MGIALQAQTPLYTLYPPTNLQVAGVECSVYLAWDEPQPVTPPGLIGYRIYRDGAYLAYISGHDTTWAYDFTVIHGDHTYSVSAYYDLTMYGYPGFFDESDQEGPAEITIMCSIPPIFCEYWDQASFAYHDWSFHPGQGNWSITTVEGYPAPAATFTGIPADTNYTYIMMNIQIMSWPFTCATFHVDFDIRLDDINSTGTEKLAVELFYNEMWHLIDLFDNTGSFGWESYHYEIPDAGGGIMKIRFRAFGENSEDIANWYLDNICVVPICNPPLSPSGIYNGQDVILSWHPPICDQGSPQSWIQEEIAYHDGNPVVTTLQYFDWVYGILFDLSAYQYALLQSIDFHHASLANYGIWKYRIHVVDWLTHTEVATVGPFYTTGDDQWETEVPLDSISGLSGGTVAIFIQPMGNTPDDAYPRISSDNSGPQGVSLFGSFPNYSALTPTTTGDYLITLRILIPDTTKRGEELLVSQESENRELIGYNVYRSVDNMMSFALLTPEPVTDTVYIDSDPPLSIPAVQYYITAIFNYDIYSFFLCESIPSDTVEIVITSIPEPQHSTLSVFPNPATDMLKVISDCPIDHIEISTYLGQQELAIQEINALKTEIDVSNLLPGMYLVKVVTRQGLKVAKITVVK
ncbi:MAG: T9SS type A sorting domain-containing protein [Bacteroidales bacterium]|nr:T9SS type A sorting domain-containing protein [Bacteroidales bacterium]